MLLAPRRRVDRGVRNHARCCARSRARVLVGCGDRMISFVFARGGVLHFVLNLFFSCIGPAVRRGGEHKKRPRETDANSSASRARRARATERGQGRGPGCVPPEPKGVGRGEPHRGRGDGAGAKTPRQSKQTRF